MSKVHNNILDCKVTLLSIIIKWVESLMKDWVSSTKGPIKWSTNCDIFSVGTLLPETIGLPGGFLWIFGKIELLCPVSINS